MSPSAAIDPASAPFLPEPPSEGASGALGGSSRSLGRAEPRVETLRPPGASEGGRIVQWARDRLAVELMPWQAYALEHGCVRHSDRWASRTVGIMVGRQNGKTMLTAVRALAGMALWEEEVLAASQNRDVALDAWNVALELAEDAELGVHSISRTNGREAFFIGRTRYKVVSSTRRGGRGLTADLVIMDEVREYRDWSGWAALEKTRRARASSQVWAISNEGDDGSVVLVSLSERGRNHAASGTQTDAAWMEWSAPPDASRTDPEAWRSANPALGHLITLDTIASEAATDDPEVFETEVLCRRVASLRPWLASGLWEACADPYLRPPEEGSPVVFAMDAGPELRHATIAVGAKRDDGRVFVEATNGYQQADGDVLPRAALRLAELCDRWSPLAVLVVARSSAEAAARRVLAGSEVRIVALTGADQVRAAASFQESVVARTLAHAGDPMTAAHLGSLTVDGVLRRRSAGSDVDAAVAIVLAGYGAMTQTVRSAPQDWVAF